MPTLPKGPAAPRTAAGSLGRAGRTGLPERATAAPAGEDEARQFGRKSEQLSEEQLLFAFEEIEATLAANAAEGDKQSLALREQQAKRRLDRHGRPGAGAVRRMHELLLALPRRFADETMMPVLDPGRGQTRKGFAWAIVCDDRPWGGADSPAVLFHYAPGRGARHPKALLAGYTGILQCDGYTAYKTLAAANSAITLAFCWSHAPREFIELATGEGQDCADRHQSPAAHCRPLCRRGEGPRPASGDLPGHPEGAEPRWSRTCSPGSPRSSPACRVVARPPRRSAMR
ncbi:MAG: transposase [Acetobacteraceae bacterium]|nr:transposase [Acetobacteraceae bacterium]